jgi:hypothetical protein
MLLGGPTHQLTIGYALDFYAPLIFALSVLLGLHVCLRCKKTSPPWLDAITAIVLSWTAIGLAHAQFDFYYGYPSIRFGLDFVDEPIFWIFFSLTYTVTRITISVLAGKKHALASEWGIFLGFCCSAWMGVLGSITA